MPTLKKRIAFYTSDEGNDTKKLLESMIESNEYNTDPTYTVNVQYPDHYLPFIDKHMSFLANHPNVEIRDYLSSLRLMSRIR